MTALPGSIQVEKWLQNGAVLAAPDGSMWLGEGPFTSSPEANPRGAWVRCDFFAKTPEFLVSSKDERVSRMALESALLNGSSLETLHRWQKPLLQDFEKKFKGLQASFSSGALKKVVPVVFETRQASLTDAELRMLLLRGLQSSTRGFLFGHWNLQEGVGVLGLSPELLFAKKGSRLETMALAGTARDEDHILLADTKELHEHGLVTEQIISQLQPFGLVETKGPYEWSPGALRHLRTDIDVRLKQGGVGFKELIKALHPTPALGGVPKEQAMDLLKSWEDQQGRGGFGAPFGYLHEADAQVIVAIRCLQWEYGQMRIGSGCGVVASSQMEREWEELERKRQSVKKVFGLQ